MTQDGLLWVIWLSAIGGAVFFGINANLGWLCVIALILAIGAYAGHKE